jgi:hypothetical protein
MDVSEIAHADCEVLGGAPLGDLHLAPGAVHVQEHEQADRARERVARDSAPTRGRDDHMAVDHLELCFLDTAGM